jgi:hypothetical protein
VGLVTRFQYKDDYFGESNAALTPTMDMISMQQQGIPEAIRNSATFRFMARLANFARAEDLRKERERFNREQLSSGSGGVLLFPNTWDSIQQIDSKPWTVDADQMKLIQDNVCRYFGVGPKILTNEATGDELAAFFDGKIETFAIKLSTGLSRMIYTERELNGGNEITFTANRLQYMNVQAKINMAQQLGDRGVLTIDEIRALFNYDPLPDGAGQYTPIRGEYKNVKDPDDKKDPDEDGGENNE